MRFVLATALALTVSVSRIRSEQTQAGQSRREAGGRPGNGLHGATVVGSRAAGDAVAARRPLSRRTRSGGDW